MERASGSGKILKLIRGGLGQETILGQIKVVAAPEGSRPFDIDAIVFEEDTWLVMSADPKVCQPEIHPIRLMTELIEARPEISSRVLTRPGRPMKFLAVVHDFNMDPTWNEEWISQALTEIFIQSENLKMKALGIPLLCTKHGRLDVDRFLLLLARAVESSFFEYLRRLWLITHPGVDRRLIDRLEKHWGSLRDTNIGDKE